MTTFSGPEGTTTAKATAGPSTAQFAKCTNCFAQDDTFVVEWTRDKQRQEQKPKQIPFGDDKQEMQEQLQLQSKCKDNPPFKSNSNGNPPFTMRL
jgi:hypothetical protein